MSRIAYVGNDRHIHLVGADGEGGVQLSSSFAYTPGAWGHARPVQESWAWPTWSPDGTEVAAVAIEAGDDVSGPARIRALSVDGVHETEWAELAGSAPIYLQWHPRGLALSILVQQQEELVLGLLRRDRLGQVRAVEQGVPLFFNWTPDGERLLVHACTKGADEGRLVLRDPLGGAEDVLFDLRPGSFCAPVFTGDDVATVVRHPGDAMSSVTVSDRQGSHARALLSRRGLLALVAAPGDRRVLAASHAPRGEGTPYKGIERVDIDTGEVQRISDADLLAFFWAPGGDWLLTARVDRDNNCLRWERVDALSGEAIELGSFWPTRNLLFYLHFFEQYASSHSVLSADGRFLVYAGYPAGGGHADLSAPPRIYVKDVLHPETPAREVGDGSFAVFSPVG